MEDFKKEMLIFIVNRLKELIAKYEVIIGDASDAKKASFDNLKKVTEWIEAAGAWYIVVRSSNSNEYLNELTLLMNQDNIEALDLFKSSLLNRFKTFKNTPGHNAIGDLMVIALANNYCDEIFDYWAKKAEKAA